MSGTAADHPTLPYPIFLDLRGRRVLLLGTGEVAERKAVPLRAAGADIAMAATFAPGLLSGCVLAIGADAPDAALRALSEAATVAGIPVNVVDRPELSTCLAPAIIDRAPVVVAISTGGSAPVLARLLRQRIEAMLPPALGALARLADGFAAELRRRLPDPADRRPLLEAALTGPAVDLLAEGRDDEARAAFAKALAGTTDGRVHLIGAGPGDADLLTLRAHRLLGQAELVVYDTEIGPALLAMARRDAAQMPAGSGATVRMIALARAGRVVARLALGDGGALQAEADLLVAAGVTVIGVPGVAMPQATDPFGRR